jgi:hypothetical protein
MKNNLIISMLAILLISFVSCSKETENPAPTMKEVTAAGNIVTVTFSEGVYATSSASGDLTDANLEVTVPNVDFTATIAHTAGSSTVTITLEYTSIVPENTQITVTTKTTVYDSEGASLASGAAQSADLASELGIIGKWYSVGDDVAPLLVTYFLVDSISAEFKDDFTYVVHQFSNGNTSPTPDVIFTGNYTIERSGVDDIWNIVISQVEPYAADVSGIFEVKQDPEKLWYEVVQTSGTQNVPPTAEGGFGSTSGGAFGETNIQKYVRF